MDEEMDQIINTLRSQADSKNDFYLIISIINIIVEEMTEKLNFFNFQYFREFNENRTHAIFTGVVLSIWEKMLAKLKSDLRKF